jgi:hypothetical protein
MNTLPTKNYNTLSTLNQRRLPMDSGVLIPQNDPVRLLVFVLKQLDLNPQVHLYTLPKELIARLSEDITDKLNLALEDVFKQYLG